MPVRRKTILGHMRELEKSWERYTTTSGRSNRKLRCIDSHIGRLTEDLPLLEGVTPAKNIELQRKAAELIESITKQRKTCVLPLRRTRNDRPPPPESKPRKSKRLENLRQEGSKFDGSQCIAAARAVSAKEKSDSQHRNRIGIDGGEGEGEDCVITAVIDIRAQVCRSLMEVGMDGKDELLWYEPERDFDVDLLP